MNNLTYLKAMIKSERVDHNISKVAFNEFKDSVNNIIANTYVDYSSYSHGDKTHEIEWIEVEGIGYGWIWCSIDDNLNNDLFNEECANRLKENMIEIVDKYTERYGYNSNYTAYTYIVEFEENGVHNIIFSNSDKKLTYWFRGSENELDW